VLVGIVLVALTMRAPIIAVAPALPDLRAGLRISAATAGLLTTIPVLCFGLGTPLVLAVVRRTGLNNAVLVGLTGTLAGILLRSAGGLSFALIGTLVIGLSITVGNVVIPVIIGRDFPAATTTVTAAYSAALNVGSMLASTLSAPVADRFGWRTSLATWGLLTVLAAVVWRPAARRSHSVGLIRAADVLTAQEAPAATDPGPERPLWRRRLVVGMVLAFAGQSFSYYGVSAWLPTLLSDDLGLSAAGAGASSSIFQVVALAGAFTVPAMMAGRLSARFVLLTVCAAWIALPLGLAFAPSLWPLWSCCGGLAQGGGFTVIFSVIVSRAVDVRDSRRMSAAVQGVGYTLGATGPFVIGFVHSLADDWVIPMLVVATAVAIMATAGSIATSPGRVHTGGRTPEGSPTDGTPPVVAGR
jgi:CP family cyanate transporter-like MFS transporter